MINRLISNMWGPVQLLTSRLRSKRWLDLVLLLSIFGLLFGFLQVSAEWGSVLRPKLTLDLSPWALPRYTFYTMTRGLAAYGLSLVFTFVYAYWVAKDARSERFLIPLLDILQSIPVLAFLLPLLLMLVKIFPNSNMGLELTAIITIFTSQVWNMTFSLYYSLKNVPSELKEVARVYRFNWFEQFKWVELPFAATGLAWNSMMSMAGGWFFLMITETIRLGEQDYRLPGLGSYMATAVEQGNSSAVLSGLLATILMILFLDQVLWRPIVTWTQRFHLESSDPSPQEKNWFLEFLRGSWLVEQWDAWKKKVDVRLGSKRNSSLLGLQQTTVVLGQVAPRLSLILLLAIAGLVAWGLIKIVTILAPLTWADWSRLLLADGLTLSRVFASTLIGLLWTLPVGLMIGLSPRWLKRFQPVVQVVASFPSSMLFPIVIALFQYLTIGLGLGSIVLMVLATQWYILFNVIAGASTIPAELREASKAFGMTRWQTFKSLYLPAILPYLVTGCLTATGGAWNASIVCEYVTTDRGPLSTFGLGSVLSEAGASGNTAQLAAATIVLATTVVLFNRIVWKKLYELAETQYSLIN